jgi:transposase
MAKSHRPYVPEQDLLLPPRLRDWLPENHLAYFVSDLIDHLGLSAITRVYEGEERRYPPYHHVMLTKVLVYARAEALAPHQVQCAAGTPTQ